MSAYRDRDAALLSRIGVARERVRALDARIAPEAYRYLPAHDLGAFEAARAPGRDAYEATEALRRAPTASLETWAMALEQFAGALEIIAARVPDLEQLALAISAEAPPIPRARKDRLFNVEPTLPDAIDFEIEGYPALLEKALQGFLGTVEQGQWSPRHRMPPPRVYFATARVEGAYISNLVEIEVPGGAPLFFTAFAVAVPRAMPPLSVVPTTSVVRRLFGDRRRFGKERETGDDAFDGAFAARSSDLENVLTPAVRKKLLALSRYDVPELTIDEGAAILRYTYDPEVPVLRAAIEVMLAVRGVEVAVRFAR